MDIEEQGAHTESYETPKRSQKDKELLETSVTRIRTAFKEMISMEKCIERILQVEKRYVKL